MSQLVVETNYDVTVSCPTILYDVTIVLVTPQLPYLLTGSAIMVYNLCIIKRKNHVCMKNTRFSCLFSVNKKLLSIKYVQLINSLAK